MRAVGLVPNTEREVARELTGWLTNALAERGIAARMPEREAAALGLDALGAPADRFVEGLDLVVALGGDGTMLHAVDLVYPATVPILGVNAGQLGYLSALEASELDGALEAVLAGTHTVSERTMVECRVEGGTNPGTWFGLNEVVLEKLDAGRVVRLEAAIAGHPFTTYAADGVIVATPTGTTAYTFSVRGPIVSPSAHLLVLTPVSPHMLFDRSLVLAPDETIELTVTGERRVDLLVDGRRVGELQPGDRVLCRVAPDRVRIVAPRDLLFHQILKAKFALPDR
jgi:NAD+ kinase